MFESLLNSPILQNPAFIAAILALARNIGGYIYNCIEAKKLLPYSPSALFVTLGLWETVFIVLAGGANLSTVATAEIAMGLDWIRGLKTAISGTDTSTSATSTQAITTTPAQILYASEISPPPAQIAGLGPSVVGLKDGTWAVGENTAYYKVFKLLSDAQAYYVNIVFPALQALIPPSTSIFKQT